MYNNYKDVKLCGQDVRTNTDLSGHGTLMLGHCVKCFAPFHFMPTEQHKAIYSILLDRLGC